MSSIKCSNCGLVNFASSQFCKRCNYSLTNVQPLRPNNETQIINQNYNTNVRQIPPLPQMQNPQNYPQNGVGGFPFQDSQSQDSQQFANYQNQVPIYHAPNYQRDEQNSYTLPRFPTEVRPPEFQQNYGQNYYQNAYYPQFYGQFDVPVRRLGNTLVIHKNAQLPHSCVKCGKDLLSAYDGGYVKENFRWHNPLLYIALISPIIYLILALCISEKFSLGVPLCQEHLESRNKTKTYLVGGGLVAAILMIISFSANAVGFGFLMLLFLIIGIPLIYEYAYKALRISKIDGSHYYLNGASNEYLNKIPY